MKKRTINKSLLKKAITLAILILLLSTVIASATNINKSSSKKNQKCKNNSNTIINSDTRAFILTTNYANSSFSIIDVDNPNIVEKDIASTHGDDEVRYYNGKVYVLNRWGFDLIEVFDAEDNFEKVSEFSTGTGTIPLDIAFISN